MLRALTQSSGDSLQHTLVPRTTSGSVNTEIYPFRKNLRNEDANSLTFLAVSPWYQQRKTREQATNCRCCAQLHKISLHSSLCNTLFSTLLKWPIQLLNSYYQLLFHKKHRKFADFVPGNLNSQWERKRKSLSWSASSSKWSQKN